MSNITIRAYKHGDEQAINSAFNRIFDQQRSVEEWRWKFGENGKSSRIMLGMDSEGHIISQWAEVLVDMRINGRSIVCAQAVDGFCLDRPGFKRRPTFIDTVSKFYKQFHESDNGIPFFYGSAGPRLYTVGREYIGLKGFIDIDYYSKETSRLIRPLSMVLGSALWKRIVDTNEVSLDQIDSLWERAKGRYSVTLQKNGAYIKRRYLTHPLNRYILIPSYTGNDLKGLLVLSYGSRVVKILDFLWDGDKEDTVSELFNKAWGVTTKLGAVKLEMWLNNDKELSGMLKSHGMTESENPYTLKLITCSFDEGIDAEEAASAFSFTMGDTDMF